jgi:hypothetical protein
MIEEWQSWDHEHIIVIAPSFDDELAPKTFEEWTAYSGIKEEDRDRETTTGKSWKWIARLLSYILRFMSLSTRLTSFEHSWIQCVFLSR